MIKGLLIDFGGTIDTDGIHWFRLFQSAYAECGYDIPEDILRQAHVYAEKTLGQARMITPEMSMTDTIRVKLGLQAEFLRSVGVDLQTESPRGVGGDLQTESPRGVGVDALQEECRGGALGGNSDGSLTGNCGGALGECRGGKGDIPCESCKQVLEIERLVECCMAKNRHNIDNVSGPVLKVLASEYKLGVVSNFYGNLNSVLAEFGIDKYFSSVTESAVVGVRKPDPEIFRIAASSLGLTPAECVVVGDSADKDIIPAQIAGCRTVWLSGSNASDVAGVAWDSTPCIPDWRISSFRDLRSIEF